MSDSSETNADGTRSATFQWVPLAMIVTAIPPCLLSLLGLFAEPSIIKLFSVLQNGYVFVAGVILLRAPKRYWLATTASLLIALEWFWLGFLHWHNGSIVLVSGSFISIAVSWWAFLTVRRQKLAFEFQADPITQLVELLTKRMPGLKPEPISVVRANRIAIGGMTGLCLTGLLVAWVSGNLEGKKEYGWQKEQREKEELIVTVLGEGDQAWDAGNKTAAIEKYLAVLDKRNVFDAPEKCRPTVARAYGRSIDTLVEQGQTSTAEQLIVQAIRSKVMIRLTSKDANELLRSGRAAYDLEQQQLAENFHNQRRAASTDGDGGSWTLGIRSTQEGPFNWGGSSSEESADSSNHHTRTSPSPNASGSRDDYFEKDVWGRRRTKAEQEQLHREHDADVEYLRSLRGR